MKWIEALESMESPDSVGIEPLPKLEDPEIQYAHDDRHAIQDVDGGQDQPYPGPVEVKIDSATLGVVDVILEPDHATVDGVKYSNSELVDLIDRGLSAADLRTVHKVKKEFDGGLHISGTSYKTTGRFPFFASSRN